MNNWNNFLLPLGQVLGKPAELALFSSDKTRTEENGKIKIHKKGGDRRNIMNTEFTHKLELLASNKNAIDKSFYFEMGMSQVVAGLLFAGAGKEADIEKMKEARNILKKKAGVFSAFRDATELVLLAIAGIEAAGEQGIDVIPVLLGREAVHAIKHLDEIDGLVDLTAEVGGKGEALLGIQGVTIGAGQVHPLPPPSASIALPRAKSLAIYYNGFAPHFATFFPISQLFW